MSLETLKDKVRRLIEAAQNSGGEDTLNAYLNYTLTQVRCESVTAFTSTHKFAEQTKLISADFPNLTRTHDYVFDGCSLHITSVTIKNMKNGKVEILEEKQNV